MTPRQQQRWTWWTQTRDVVTTIVGVAVTGSMVWRNEYPPLGVVVALVCLGVISSSAATAWLIGRGDAKPPTRPEAES